MAYWNGSCRNNGCRCNNNTNTGAGCVCDNNGNCSCSNGIGGCNTGSCGCNTNTCGCNNSGVGGCNTNTCGCNRPCYPNRPSVCPICPPGTFPCPCRPPFFRPDWNVGPCNTCNGNGNNACGCNGNVDSAFAFLNSTGSNLTTGSIVPLRYVLGTGSLAKNTSGGTVSLDSGTYSIAYSLSGIAPEAGITVTVTPEYGGVLHPEFARSFTSSAAAQSFELSGLFAVTLPTDTTVSLNVTFTGDVAADASITGVNASMLVKKMYDTVS